MRLTIAILGFILIPVSTSAHHSRAEYDETVTELTGTVERVQWMNPHVRFTLLVPGEDGVTVRWNLEGMDLGRLDRAGIPHDIISVGNTLLVAGNVSSRRSKVFVRNVLLPDNTELILEPNTQPRWPEAERVVGSAYPMIEPSVEGALADAVDVEADGIFRVWANSMRRGNRPPAFASDPPFTDAGRAGYDSYDPAYDDPVLDCTPPGVPRIITRHPGLIEFVDQGEKIAIRTGGYGGLREVHMDLTLNFQGEPLRPLGYSLGQWDGRTLIVTTSRIAWPYHSFYGFEGAPQSADAVITERFSVSEDESEMTYDIIVDDPFTFTEPVSADGYFVYSSRPGLEVTAPSECGPEFAE